MGRTMKLEIRLFNSLQRYARNGSPRFPLEVAGGSTLGDVVRLLQIPDEQIFVAMRNGVNAEILAPDRFEAALRDGDAVALSGPIPWSRGYGSPVV